MRIVPDSVPFGPPGLPIQILRLPCAEDQPLLKQNLEVAELLEQKIKQLDRTIGQSQSEEEKLLESIPGIGPLFSSVIATEIDGIARFNSPAKTGRLCRSGAHYARQRRTRV